MKNKVLASLVSVGAIFVGCSSETTSEPNVAETTLPVQKESMWAALQRKGVPEYFDSLAQEGLNPVVNSSSVASVRCAAPALSMDANTRYLDELESVFDEGVQVDGVCGKALKLNDGNVAPLGINLIDSLRVGTVEFWFRPNEDFQNKFARTLLGNDESRLHFFYKDGNLVFQKNHADQHFFAMGPAEFTDGWNLVAGQWGDGYLSVWLNGQLVAKVEHDLGYAPSLRDKPFGNLLVIGYKSECCMEGPGQYSGMTTSGSYDQVRISNIARYEVPVNQEVETPEQADSCSVGISITANLHDTDAIALDLIVEKMCAPDYVVQVMSDEEVLDNISFSLKLRSGDVVNDSLAIGEVHYGCIDLTDPIQPLYRADKCTLAPGEYRFEFNVEGKSAYYKFRVKSSVEIDTLVVDTLTETMN